MKAFLLATQAEAHLGADPVLASAWSRISRMIPITTMPEGADVSFRLIGRNDEWHLVGRTPLTSARVPRGGIRVARRKGRVRAARVHSGDIPAAAIDFGITLPAVGTRPQGMVGVSVPRLGLRLTLTGFDYNKGVPSPDYFIDRHEVTNAEFKEFVDAGGYVKREYWTEPFVRDGAAIDWTTAMTLVPRSHRQAGAGDVAGRRVSLRSGAVPCRRCELVRGGSLCGVSREASPDDLPLDACGGTGVWQFDHAHEQFRWRRSCVDGRPSGAGTLRDV